MSKPRKFDLEMTFKLNDALRSICVNVKQCPVCKDLETFARVCPVCGRWSKTQKGVFLQVARESPLTSIQLTPDPTEANIPEPKNSRGSVVAIPRRAERETGDDEPTAS